MYDRVLDHSLKPTPYPPPQQYRLDAKKAGN